METSDKQKEEWRLVISRKKNGDEWSVERRMETSDKQKKEWRLVISRKKNGDQ